MALEVAKVLGYNIVKAKTKTVKADTKSDLVKISNAIFTIKKMFPKLAKNGKIASDVSLKNRDLQKKDVYKYARVLSDAIEDIKYMVEDLEEQIKYFEKTK